MNNLIQVFTEIALNLYINLERINVFTMASSPSHEHDMSFHLFRSSLISGINIFNFQYTDPIHVLIGLYPRISLPLKQL